MQKRFLRVLLGLLSTIGVCVFSGCESTPKPYDDNFSTLPQNRPQAWEGSAAMGSFFPGSN
ncbi:MAG: hypothetical protein ABL994_16695 [Verrucomicrobiales bacterium]